MPGAFTLLRIHDHAVRGPRDAPERPPECVSVSATDGPLLAL